MRFMQAARPSLALPHPSIPCICSGLEALHRHLLYAAHERPDGHACQDVAL